MIRWVSILAVAVVLAWPGQLEAEIIHLKNGDKVVGKVLKQDERILVVDVGGVTLNLPVSEVAKIEGQPPKPTPTPVPAVRSLLPSPERTQQALDPLSLPSLPASSEVTAASFPELPILPVVLPPGRTFRVSGSAVRFRDGPGLDYDPVDTLLRGTLLTEIENVDNWSHARTFDGLEGWMHQDYLEPMANIPVVVTADRLNLRDGPSRAYRTVQRLRRGDVLILLNEQGAWWRIQSSTLNVGWCSADYLIKVESLDIIRPRLFEEDLEPPTMSRAASPSGEGETISLTTTNNDLVIRGLTKIVALCRDGQTLSSEEPIWSGRDVLRTEILPDQAALARVGFDRSIARRYKGAYLLLVRGRRAASQWSYTFVAPPTESIDYAVVVQKGEQRGAVLRARPGP